jgi:hypothetical protein
MVMVDGVEMGVMDGRHWCRCSAEAELWRG